MKKDLFVAVIIMLALPSKAQEYIKAMPVVPKKGFQTFEQYIKTHEVSDMDGDTVTLANIYGTIGYAVMDRYLGRIDRDFFLMMQDAVYEDDKNVDYKKMFYVPISPSKYELTEINTNVIKKKKLKEDFIFTQNNSFFFRNDKFVVKAEWYYGRKRVTFHCLTYPKHYILAIGEDKEEKKVFVPPIDRNSLMENP